MLNFDELNQLLNDIKNKASLEGIILAYRDGGLLFENMGDELESQNFASMCATVLESASGLGETINNQKIRKIIAEVEDTSVLILECGEKTFLILIIKKESNVGYIFSKLTEVVQAIVKLY